MKLQNDVVIKDLKKVMFVGDIHFSHLTPASRIDEYPTIILNKFSSLLPICQKEGIKVIILLGDVFHRPKQPIEYMVQVLRIFSEFKSHGIRIFTIIGNHCLTYNRIDTVHDSALGLLAEAGVVEHLTTIETDKFKIIGSDYPDLLKPNKDISLTTLLVAHKFYESSLSPSDSIFEEHLPLLNYNYIILGHDHANYDIETKTHSKGYTTIVRPGSFSRGTSHTYQLHKKIQVAVFDIDAYSMRYIEIPHKSKHEVFAETVLNKVITQNETSLENFSFLIQEISKVSNNSSSIYTYLDEIEDKSIKDLITAYLQTAGIYNNQ